jgi:hypothetical protein
MLSNSCRCDSGKVVAFGRRKPVDRAIPPTADFYYSAKSDVVCVLLFLTVTLSVLIQAMLTA